MPLYRFSCKSEEQRGAGQPNIVTLNFADDASAEAFGTNLGAVLAGDVVTIDKVISEDYSLPYPVGTGIQARLATFTTEFKQWQARLRDCNADVDWEGFAAALIGAGWLNPYGGDFEAATNINVTVMKPAASAFATG